MQLELRAPAGNRDIGIAAIDCGADAVYIAGPRFGARQAAGNPVAEIGELARYAHRYNARVYAVVNTILFDDELEAARRQMVELAEAGVDAFIIQDLGLLKLDLPALPLFASTQTVIRTPEEARRLEALGFQRLILERQISLDQIRAIRSAVQCELEFFVHGALCVSYSGQCYLSQALTGRSANRGTCVQACRSLYDLVDADGHVLLHDRSLLSLKDFRLDDRLGDLIAAGISSFKIEGRLKNASYVKNVVRHYRARIDAWLEKAAKGAATADGSAASYTRASAGRIVGGFTPDIDATFNRGYTTAFLDGRRGAWNSVDAAKSLGAYLGTITAIDGNTITIDTDRVLAAGDGLAFVPREGASGIRGGELTGMRIESVFGRTSANGSPASSGLRIRLKSTAGLYRGQKVYRNLDSALERELERNMPRRLIDAVIDYRSFGGTTTFTATAEDGRRAEVSIAETADVARNAETALESLRSQLSKTSEPYRFTLGTVESDAVYFYPAAFLNGIRRDLAERLAARSTGRNAGENAGESARESAGMGVPENGLADNPLIHSKIRKVLPLPEGGSGLNNSLNINKLSAKAKLDYRANCANHLAREVLTEMGAETVAPAYELEAPRGAEVMRSRYCIKYELGLCPKCQSGDRLGGVTSGTLREPLYLENNGRRLQLKFDCKNCEMVVLL
ncbi:MAG: U32 family peptidase [Bacteroidales bacterium]|nr:U32 family peptidase [Bacteroidales bacterium]